MLSLDRLPRSCDGLSICVSSATTFVVHIAYAHDKWASRSDHGAAHVLTDRLRSNKRYGSPAPRPRPPCGGPLAVHTQRESDNSLRARSRWQLKRRTLASLIRQGFFEVLFALLRPARFTKRSGPARGNIRASDSASQGPGALGRKFPALRRLRSASAAPRTSRADQAEDPVLRAEQGFPRCLADFSAGRRLSNKRLKPSAPPGAGWRCDLGRRACHKEVVDFTRCGGSRRSLSAER